MVPLCRYAPGHVIIKEGADVSALHIIYSGQVHVSTGALQGGVQQPLGEGAVFGEGALRLDRASSTYVVGDREVTCMAISRHLPPSRAVSRRL